MNKSDLVDAVAQHAELTKSSSAKAVDAVFSAIKDCLGRGEEVRLVDFGTFSVSLRKATEGRNPQTGAPIKIPAKKVTKFKAGKKLSETVSG